jgi:hypothetical protein
MSTVQAELFDVGHRTMSRVELLCRIAERMGYCINFANGIVEPGYNDKPTVFGNWNSRTKYNPDTGVHQTLDETMPRLAKLFEKLGYEVGWEDEWGICDDCGKAIRMSPDSYSWKPYYWLSDGGIVCGDCVKSDPTDYLEFLRGNDRHCLSFDIDLTEYGYSLYKGDYEAGFHPGQNADPRKIAIELRQRGIMDFIFVLDSTGQFDISFSVWVKGVE